MQNNYKMNDYESATEATATKADKQTQTKEKVYELMKYLSKERPNQSSNTIDSTSEDEYSENEHNTERVIEFSLPDEQFHHVCLTCFEQFRTYSNIQKHIVEHHPQTERPLKRLRMF